MKKSKIIVPAVALLALGMAASVTGTVAWYSVQATTKISFGASVTAPGSLLSVSGYNPFGYTVDTSATVGAPSLSAGSDGQLTDVTSSDGKAFTKYGLKDNVVDKSGENTYIVSKNAYCVAAAQNDATTGWVAPGANDITSAIPSASSNKLQLTGVKNGTFAYARFGFTLTNMSANAINITVLKNKVKCLVTPTAEHDAVDAFKLTIAKASAADNKYSSIPTATPKACGVANSEIDTGFSFDSSLAASASASYVVTVWVDGEVTNMNNDTVASGNVAIDLQFSAVEA